MEPTAPAIECAGLTKRYGDLTAVDHLDLSVEEGTVMGFLGPNGAGKTTTIRMLLGLARPTHGRAHVFGHDAWTDVAVRRRIGYLPGELRLDPRLGVEETLRFWSRLRGDVDEKRLAALVERFELDVRRRTRDLSTGNRRRVGLVGALMGRPDLLILDEPTSGLDPLMREQFLSVIREVRADGSTVLLSSHVIAEVAQVADTVALIDRGRILAVRPMTPETGPDDLLPYFKGGTHVA